MIVTSKLQAKQVGRLTRQLVGYQFGGYLLPRIQYTAECSFKFRSTLDDHAFMVDGSIDTAKGIKRAPIEPGAFKCSGKYAQTFVKNRLVGCLAQSEYAGIMSYSGTWQQLVVYMHDNTAGDCDDCEMHTPDGNGGVWLWTWAKIEEPSTKSQIDDILKGAEAAEFTFVLREPFREVDTFAWRYGEPPPIRQSRTMKEMEQLVFSGNGRRPSVLPDCGEPARWYYRDPLSCINPSCMCFYETDCLWGTDNYRFSGYASMAVNVPGTFEATGYIRSEGNGTPDGTIIRVINDTYFVQEVTLKAGETVDMDAQSVYTGCTPKSTNISRFPRIVAGINRFEVVGRALIGIRPRWIF